MARAANNEIASTTRREFAQLVRRFDKSHLEWRKCRSATSSSTPRLVWLPSERLRTPQVDHDRFASEARDWDGQVEVVIVPNWRKA